MAYGDPVQCELRGAPPCNPPVRPFKYYNGLTGCNARLQKTTGISIRRRVVDDNAALSATTLARFLFHFQGIGCCRRQRSALSATTRVVFWFVFQATPRCHRQRVVPTALGAISLYLLGASFDVEAGWFWDCSVYAPFFTERTVEHDGPIQYFAKKMMSPTVSILVRFRSKINKCRFWYDFVAKSTLSGT